MKYLKILIDIRIWHLIPYRIKAEDNHAIYKDMTEIGWLCFKLITTWKPKKTA